MSIRRHVRKRWVVAGAAVAVLATGTAAAAVTGTQYNPFGSDHVGTQADGSVLLPDNQFVTPVGVRTQTNGLTVGTAISPDGSKIAVQTRAQLRILDAATGAIVQTFGGRGVSAPLYSPDGTALYEGLSTSSSGSAGTGSIVKYDVGADGLVTNPTDPLTIPLGTKQTPYSLALSSDGGTLYSTLNGTNELAVIDTATARMTGEVAVGNAPQGIAIVDGKAFVTNRGGRPAASGDTTNLSYGTKIVSDPVTGASTTGTVSVVDLSAKQQVTAPAAPDIAATPADILDVDFADGTPTDHAQNLPATTYGAPVVTKDTALGTNVATFNGSSDAYAYPFSDQWSKIANGFTVECKFRWNGSAPSTADHGVCSDTNSGGFGVHVLNGEAMTYAHIGGAYKEIFDPTPVVPGTWYDVITTWDGNTLNEYVNGVRVATMPAPGAMGLPTPNSTAWHFTLGADASAGGIEMKSPVTVASSKIWSKPLASGPDVPVTVPTSPDTAATAPDVVHVDFADGTPAEQAQGLPATTYGTPSITSENGANVATFNGSTDAYTYPFEDQWPKLANQFTVECKFRWNGTPPDTADHGVCSDTNSGGIGVHVLNGKAMTYAHIGGAYKQITDTAPVVPGTWYDVITTWDGHALTEYVNGEQVATMPATGALGLPQPDATAYHWTLGADASAGGIEMKSPVSIAASNIWSTALPSAGTSPVENVGAVTDTIDVGLQPASITEHGGSLFVTNTNADTVSIIDATSHAVMQTFSVEPLPGSTVGAAPNSVAFPDDKHLLVSVGRDNAIAVFGYQGPKVPVQYEGLIPTDGYPNEVSYDAAVNKVIVSNQDGVSTDGQPKTSQVSGTVTSFTMPTDGDLGRLTKQVFTNNGWTRVNDQEGDGSKGGTVAVPAVLGQPSAIKHVFLIIKENRTYDQILGDDPRGNGSVANNTYPQNVTPNQHSLADTFTLFDNFYDNGMVSADGHNWLLQGDNNDYQAQNAATSWGRSYPYPGGDALTYQRDGFIWNTVEAAGKTVRNYGEFEPLASGKQGTWQQYYADSQIMEGKAVGDLPIATDSRQWHADVPSLDAISNPDYPHFDTAVPDQYRTDIWERDFTQAEQTGKLANLTIMTLGDDHTGGAPTGPAQVADNDLAVGRIVSDVSHSQFWKDSAIFILEDDTQAGNDHVDAHRGPLFIASPYAKRGVVNSEYYSQINVVKTIEQILGAQPMNQMDRAAVPMFDAFTNTPDLAPYTTVPNNVDLTTGVTGLIPLTPAPTADPSTAAAVTAATGPAAPAVPAAEQDVASQWASWYQTEAEPHLEGKNAQVDSVNPAQLNRYDWYTATGWVKPYPGDTAILAPDQVPGRNLPSDLLGDD